MIIYCVSPIDSHVKCSNFTTEKKKHVYNLTQEYHFGLSNSFFLDANSTGNTFLYTRLTL